MPKRKKTTVRGVGENVFAFGVLFQGVGITAMILSIPALLTTLDYLAKDNFLGWHEWRWIFMTLLAVGAIFYGIGRAIAGKI